MPKYINILLNYTKIQIRLYKTIYNRIIFIFKIKIYSYKKFKKNL